MNQEIYYVSILFNSIDYEMSHFNIKGDILFSHELNSVNVFLQGGIQ